jgi:anti-anti-sigma factor
MRTESLGMTVADAGEDCLVTCEGGLDWADAGRFRDSLDAVLDLHPDRIFLDFSRVSSIDPSGVGAVMHLALACRAKGILLTACMNETLRRVFDPIGVSSLISLRS